MGRATWRPLRPRSRPSGRRQTPGPRHGLSLNLGNSLCAGIATLLLSACAPPGPEERLENYLRRLSRPIEASFTAPTTPRLVAPPRAEALQLPIEGSTLDGLDFLRLRGCALQATIARRNSSLGRVAPPSQRLLLELAFLREAPPCIARLRAEDDSSLAGELEQAQRQKQQQLPRLIFNATLGTREFRAFWRGQGDLATYPEDTSSLVVTALEAIDEASRRWLSGDYAADDTAFELALGDIARGDGGELRRALALQHAWLELANAQIDARQTRGPLCRADLLPAAAPILRTVVQKYFVGEVQPWSAALNQRYHQLLDPLEALEAQLDDSLPPSYRDWREQRDATLERHRAAPASHVRQVQALLGPCYAEFQRASGPTDETAGKDATATG